MATVFDLFVANYGLDRGFGGGNVARDYDDDVPYTPAWAERITGVPREQVDYRRARVRRQRREDQWPLDGDPRRRR